MQQPSPDSQAQPTRGKIWPSLLAGLLLTAYLGWLGWSAWNGRFSIERPPVTLAVLQNAERMADWASHASQAALREAGLLLPVGLLLPLVLGRGRTRSAGLGKWLVAVLLTVAVSAVLRGFEVGGPPAVGRLILPAIGGLLGVCLGTTLLGGWRAAAKLVPALVLLLLVVSGTGVWLLDACLDRKPLDFEPPQITTQEKRRVVNRVRYQAERRLDDGVQTRLVRMADEDLNFLLAWWHSLGPTGGKTRVHAADEGIETEASFPVTLPTLGVRHLNVRMTGRLEIDKNRRLLEVEKLQVAHVDLSNWLSAFLSLDLQTLLDAGSDVGNVLDAIRRVDIEPGSVGVVYEEQDFTGRVLPALTADVGEPPELTAAVRAQVRHLIEVAPTLPSGDARFGAFVQAAFGLARQRTEFSEPVLENRAAVFALAVLFGHNRVEWLTGQVLDDELRRQAKKRLGKVTIRGRGDWTQHFFVSAALAVSLSETISNAIGLLKEELDAGLGGSGFSFADLLADRAGTRFGRSTVRDEAAALEMQRNLSGQFRIGDLFPVAGDLPEGLSDAELNSRFGGVGGEDYRKMIDEIERRLDRCRHLE